MSATDTETTEVTSFAEIEKLADAKLALIEQKVKEAKLAQKSAAAEQARISSVQQAERARLATQRFHSNMKKQIELLNQPGQRLLLLVEASLPKEVFAEFTAKMKLSQLFDLRIECSRTGCTELRETTPKSTVKFSRFVEASLSKEMFAEFTAKMKLWQLFDRRIECSLTGCTELREITPKSIVKFARLCEKCYGHYCVDCYVWLNSTFGVQCDRCSPDGNRRDNY